MEEGKRQPYLAGNFQLKIDLEKCALYQLDFLKSVYNSTPLSSGVSLERAIWRYENLWLPLAAEIQDTSGIFPAPLDVEWVWHCHLLSPLAYEKDCLAIVGKLVDHELMSVEARKTKLYKAKDLWQSKYPGEIFDYFNLDGLKTGEAKSVIDNSGSKLTYDIRGAMSRQKEFYYQVSLPHFKDRKFLATALDRYRRFLYLRQQFPSVFLVPSYDIDLMWHTHQLHPKHYQTDTKALLGRTFNHDDSVSDRSPGSKLSLADRETRNLWKDTFNEMFSMFGGMYRGSDPSGKLTPIPRDRLIASKKCTIALTRIDVEGLSSSEPKLELCIYLKNRYSGTKAKVTNLRMSGGTWVRDVAKFIFEGVNFNGLEFTVKQKTGSFCCRVTEDLGAGFDEMVSAVEGCYPDRGELTRTVNLEHSNGVKLKYVMRCGKLKLGPIALRVTTGTYETCVMPESVEQMWGHIPLGRLPPGTYNTCEVASHRLVNHLGDLEFTCRTIHSLPLLMSAVQVFYQDKMAAVAHLIGTDQLPLKSQVSDEQSRSVSLKPGVGERAVLIKNNAGDWGILLGHWVGMRKGIPGTTGTRYHKGMRGTPGSPGHLKVKLYKMTSQSWQTVNTRYESQDYDISINNAKVNLSSGVIRMKNSKTDVAETRAAAFSIGLLHVLCQPRPKLWKPGYKPPARGGRSVQTIPSEDMVLILAAGYIIGTPTNQYLYSTHGAGWYGLCAGCVGMGEAWCAHDHDTGDTGSVGDMDYDAAYRDGDTGGGDGGGGEAGDAGGCGGCGGCGSGGYGAGYEGGFGGGCGGVDTSGCGCCGGTIGGGGRVGGFFGGGGGCGGGGGGGGCGGGCGCGGGGGGGCGGGGC